MASKETPRGGEARDTHNMSGSKIQCIDCKTELNSGKVKSLKCDFLQIIILFQMYKAQTVHFQ